MSKGRAPRRTLLAVGTALSALALAACSSDGGTQGGSGGTNFVVGKDGVSNAAKGERAEAPRLKGEGLDGKQLDLADYKGKVVVLNVWGSWCAPCRAEAPYLAKVAKATKDKGVEFVGINTRDPNKQPAIEFENDFDVEYPSFYDPAGKLMLRFPNGTMSPKGIPSTVVVDREGKIAARALQALDDKQLHKMIDPLIAEK
ncbi:Thiol-disulfide oxidoreductase ResA [Streptomyces sp. YIM 130001]|uniref:TlpA family protein disulfide reductase n=1 Tax=Streptomyces sp. YIM 130001 TaxID=2259644 RepID=UPI000E6478A0|nr:TlpA disulfide reductase family protein [Streptomyces sp. YIM 130001]RII22143.1 Thiol-disulfide oxidoreductase ResA [Streptomyces sp. YIM 130001]